MGRWAEMAKRPWLCRNGMHKLRWEPAALSGYWQLMCQRPACRSMQCFTNRPSPRLGKGLPS